MQLFIVGIYQISMIESMNEETDNLVSFYENSPLFSNYIRPLCDRLTILDNRVSFLEKQLHNLQDLQHKTVDEQMRCSSSSLFRRLLNLFKK